MLNEPASSLDDHVAPSGPSPFEEDTETDPLYTEIRTAVETVMSVREEEIALSDHIRQRREDIVLMPDESRLLMIFKGRFLMDAEVAYRTLDGLFQPYNLLPVFREEKNDHVIYVIEGRTHPNDGGVWLSIILFVLTLASVFFVGANHAISDIMLRDRVLADQLASDFTANIWRGWPYALSILLILGGHELGHYFLAKRHRTAASLPYFIPFPLGVFGTFGAAIRLREPMRNRKVLFDIGAAGPLAGLLFAVPVLLIGLATSPLMTEAELFERLADEGQQTLPMLQEGNSITYALAKFIVFGKMLPDGTTDVFINQVAFAGWTGLLITGLNLIPVGQLDGGHILYSLLGRRAKSLYLPLVAGLFLLSLLVANELLVFVVLIFLMGNVHATPLDDVTELDPRRRSLAIFMLIVFVLVFVPAPLQAFTLRRSMGGGGLIWLPMVMMTLWMSRARVYYLLRRLI